MRVIAGKLTLAATLGAATLYGAVAFAGNTSPSMLDATERAEVEKLIPFDMDGFVLHDEPRPFRGKTFFDPDGEEIDLSAFEGNVTVLNFWATICAHSPTQRPSCRGKWGCWACR
jgi:cytochrome oxidase Cu insertion factor (SCO1/SenC/PrrC family)